MDNSNDEHPDPGLADLSSHNRISRRAFLKYTLAVALAAAIPSQSTVSAAEVEGAYDIRTRSATLSTRVLSHEHFLEAVLYATARRRLEPVVRDFKKLMVQTAESCVLDAGNWIIPSRAYSDYFYARDSYWILSALKDRRLSELAVSQFRENQIRNGDGRVATALGRSGTNPELLRRDDESALIYVLHNYLLRQLGGLPQIDSLRQTRDFILSRVREGKYFTTGETRQGPLFDGPNQLGTYHYWADTYRPAGRPEATPQVITYNQGLLCVALRCLRRMGIDVDQGIYRQAELAYASTVNPADSISLPQREGSQTMDVSSLVGEALSLFLFDKPLLSSKRVQETINRFASVNYRDGSFLGFKVISDFSGGHCPSSEFSGTPINSPGRYHNGASWLLYDALALYAGARHQVPEAADLFVQRLASEFKTSRASHEYLRTNVDNLGEPDTMRDGYGWNAFVVVLLP